MFVLTLVIVGSAALTSVIARRFAGTASVVTSLMAGATDVAVVVMSEDIWARLSMLCGLTVISAPAPDVPTQ